MSFSPTEVLPEPGRGTMDQTRQILLRQTVDGVVDALGVGAKRSRVVEYILSVICVLALLAFAGGFLAVLLDTHLPAPRWFPWAAGGGFTLLVILLALRGERVFGGGVTTFVVGVRREEGGHRLSLRAPIGDVEMASLRAGPEVWLPGVTPALQPAFMDEVLGLVLEVVGEGGLAFEGREAARGIALHAAVHRELERRGYVVRARGGWRETLLALALIAASVGAAVLLDFPPLAVAALLVLVIAREFLRSRRGRRVVLAGRGLPTIWITDRIEDGRYTLRIEGADTPREFTVEADEVLDAAFRLQDPEGFVRRFREATS